MTVYYSGFLKNGKKFDHSTKGPGFKFKLGAGRVIKGWDMGVVGMKVSLYLIILIFLVNNVDALIFLSRSEEKGN